MLFRSLFVDDARLVLLNAEDAINRGAKVLTNTSIISTKRNKNDWEIVLNTGETLKSKVIVNATGPYAVDVLKNVFDINSKKKLRLIQGSHIVVNKLYEGEQSYILQLNDKRIIFLIPYLNKYTLIGTTDHEVSSYENPKITEKEKQYLINSVNEFIESKISDKDIVWTYAGVRPLVEDFNEKASKITRDYTFEINDAQAPILTIFGGKLTTYRKLAEHALSKLANYLNFPDSSWTGKEILPGGNIALKSKLNIPKKMISRLKNIYGDKIYRLNEFYLELDNGGEKISEDLYEFEVKYLVEEELVKTVDDILFRRTKLGIDFPANSKEKLSSILKRHL